MSARAFLLPAALASLAGLTSIAAAAPPWVDRHLTLPKGDWAFDLGLGIEHPPILDPSVGINTEMGVGITERVELGVRTGVRLGGDPAQSVLFRRGRGNGDSFGRLFDRQTFDTGTDTLANPELRVRGALVRGSVAELALEGRLVLPIASASDAGLLFGVPLSFHLGDRVRLDTGAYVPVVFRRPTTLFAISLPLDVWIQVSRRVWLGPMTGVVFTQPGDTGSRADLSLGFGFGWQITHYLDFKAMVLFPTLDSESRFFGIGSGVEIRIE
jgi:hypothetical protein